MLFEKSKNTEIDLIPKCKNILESLNGYRLRFTILNVEKAIQYAMENKEYVLGEIPLTDEEKKEKQAHRNKNEKLKPFSVLWMKASNPKYIYKGGRKILLDEDNYDFPDYDFRVNEEIYLSALQERLSKGCSITYFIPLECKEFVRMCGAINFYEKKKFNEKSEKNEDGPYKQLCVGINYHYICSNSIELYDNMVNLEKFEKHGIFFETPKLLSESILPKVVSINIFDSFSVQQFSLATYYDSLIKNIHLQRIIFDNFNFKFVNSMIEGYKNHNYCMTFNQCWDRNLKLNGISDNNQYTGIREIDFIFKSMTKNKILQLEEEKFYVSMALGNMPYFELNRLMKENEEDLELELGINLDNGIMSFDDDFFYDLDFMNSYSNKVSMYFLKLYNHSKSLQVGQIFFMKNYFGSSARSKIKNFTIEVKEITLRIRKKLIDLEEQLGFDKVFFENQKSIKNLEAFSLITLEAIEEITHIQPEFGVAVEMLKNYKLRMGISGKFLTGSFQNEGSTISFKDASLDCRKILELANLETGNALKSYYQYYPIEKSQMNGYNHYKSLKSFIVSIHNLFLGISQKCSVLNRGISFKIFAKEFEEHGYIDRINLDNFDIKFNNEFSELNHNKKSENYKRVKSLISKMQIFADIFYKTNKAHLESFISTSPEYYFKIENEKLSQIEGYEVGNRKANIKIFVKLFNYILTSMAFNFITYKNVWENLYANQIDKSEKSFLDKDIPSLMKNNKSKANDKKKFKRKRNKK